MAHRDFLTSSINSLLSGERLGLAANSQVVECLFEGKASEAQIAAILTAWRILGETSEELTIAAAAMRARALVPTLPIDCRPLSDNCGTGGDGSNSFNVSTASAIVAASCGVTIAKHGNRSVSSRCGSADLLFECGYPPSLSADDAGQLLKDYRFTFLFAPNFHPAMRHVMPVRKSLGVRTIFNLLGPLANPLAPEFQLLGVGFKSALRPMAEALAKMSVKRALVVHSSDGLDEISPADVTSGYLVEDGKLSAWHFDPKSLGISGSLRGLTGGDPATNRQILEQVLGGAPGDATDAVTLNAGALIWLCDKASSIQEGVTVANQSLASGQAKTFFYLWLDAAKKLNAKSDSGKV